MKRVLVASAALLVSLAAAAAASAGKLGPVGSLPPGWSHAQVNVVVKHVAHTLTYDRGRVQAVTPTSVTLKERDGTVQTIAVGPATKVTIAGRPGTVAQIRRLETAMTVSVDGAPAATVTVQIPPALAAALARRAARR